MPAWKASAQAMREAAMGYVPPSRLIVLPKDVAITPAMEMIRGDIEAQLAQLYNIWDTPRAVTRPYTPSSYAEYRRSLYGPPSRDWMPFLSAAWMVLVIALFVAITWALA